MESVVSSEQIAINLKKFNVRHAGTAQDKKKININIVTILH